MKITAFCDIAPCSVADRRFRKAVIFTFTAVRTLKSHNVRVPTRRPNRVDFCFPDLQLKTEVEAASKKLSLKNTQKMGET
jgi:hypothetical protein